MRRGDVAGIAAAPFERIVHMYEYEGTRRVSYDFGDEIGRAQFIPVCEKCGRFVKPGTVTASLAGLKPGPNAECSRCGPSVMLFEGFF